MLIAHHKLTSNVFLAPMAGISDSPFRGICRKLGAGLTTTEMVIIKPELLKNHKSKNRLNFKYEQSPISVQIAGADVKQMVLAAQYAAKLGADIIDINMGCPAKKVCNKAAGSALMKDEKLVKDILTTVALAVDIPITLKTRIGWDNNNINVLNIAKIAQDAGIKAIAIHGRTRDDKYTVNASYDTIAQVVAQLDIPVIVNGDIDSAIKAQQVLKYTKAAGVMVGRAAQGNPWLIAQISYLLQSSKLMPQISLANKCQLILQHIRDIYDFYGEYLGLRLARKHIFYYANHLNKENSHNFWQIVNKITNIDEQYNTLEFFLKNMTYEQ